MGYAGVGSPAYFVIWFDSTEPVVRPAAAASELPMLQITRKMVLPQSCFVLALTMTSYNSGMNTAIYTCKQIPLPTKMEFIQ